MTIASTFFSNPVYLPIYFTNYYYRIAVRVYHSNATDFNNNTCVLRSVYVVHSTIDKYKNNQRCNN